jgi:hypothetical protein
MEKVHKNDTSNTTIVLCRDINEFKKGHQPGIKLVTDKKGHRLTDTCSILNGWKNYFG